MLHLVSPHRVHGPARRHIVNDMAVGAGDDGGVVGAFGPALDLHAAEARVHQLPHVVDHAHVPGVEDVGALLILEHREILPRPLLLHEIVLVAAGLGAGAPVAVPTGHVVGKKAAPGVAHTHGAVDEGLQLQVRRRLVPDLPDLGKAQLPGQDHPFGPQVVPGAGADVVGHTGLGTHVALTAGGVLPRQGEGSHVRQDQGVHPGLLELLQVGRKAGYLMVSGHGVHRDMDPNAVAVGKGHRPWQLLRGEVPGEGAHAKGRPRQVYGVGPVEHRHPQPLKIPRRGQQLRLCSLSHGSPPLSRRRWPRRPPPGPSGAR